VFSNNICNSAVEFLYPLLIRKQFKMFLVTLRVMFCLTLLRVRVVNTEEQMGLSQFSIIYFCEKQ